jgi:hypothetical protein
MPQNRASVLTAENKLSEQSHASKDLFRALVRGASNAAYTIDIFSRGLGANEAGQNHEPEPRAIGEQPSTSELTAQRRHRFQMPFVVTREA